jgi:hypothetical protein
MNPTVELVLKHKKENMRKSELLMLEALKSVPHLNDSKVVWFALLHHLDFQLALLNMGKRLWW